MSTLLSIGGMVSTVSVNAAPFAAGMLAVMRQADQTRDHILANNAAIGASYTTLQQKVGVDVFKPLTASAQAAQRNVKAAVDQTAVDAARADVEYWERQRRGAIAESKAIEKWLKGRIDSATLQKDLERAKKLRG